MDEDMGPLIARRAFLLGAAALVATPVLAKVIVPERKIFLPPKGGWPVSSFALPDYQKAVVDNIIRFHGDLVWHFEQETGVFYFTKDGVMKSRIITRQEFYERDWRYPQPGELGKT